MATKKKRNWFASRAPGGAPTKCVVFKRQNKPFCAEAELFALFVFFERRRLFSNGREIPTNLVKLHFKALLIFKAFFRSIEALRTSEGSLERKDIGIGD